ncbi:MAG: tRNA pseudouridine(38-40) synthase TruA [Lachnospirales bacterium]
MNNYKILVSYDGSNHNGWQSQGNTRNTVENILENTIQELVGEKVEVIGSGRTDKGVHAIGQVANFKTSKKLDVKKFVNDINTSLPTSIVIKSCESVGERFHARLNAKSKTYVYKVLNTDIYDPLRRNSVCFVKGKLDFDKMEMAMNKFKGTKDFVGFSSLGKSKKSTVRTIDCAEIIRVGDEIHFVFKGNGFLYNGVRIIVGSVIEVGLGSKTLDDIDLCFKTNDRQYAGMTIQAVGLYLESVDY